MHLIAEGGDNAAMTSHDLAFRNIEDGDAAAVVALWQAAGVARPWNDPDTDIAFARRSSHSTIRIGLDNGQIVTTAMVGEDGHRGWVYYAAVAPERQGQGYGRALMDDAEQWLSARGVWKMQLLVRADNASSIGFYEALGYANTRTVCLQKQIEPAQAPGT